MDRRVGTRIPSSMRTMAWLHFRTPAGPRVHLIPCLAFFIGWACGKYREHSRHGLPLLPGGGESVGGGVQGTDNWGDPHLPVMTEGMGPVQVVWGVDGGRICGLTQDDLSWASGRGATELKTFGHGGRAADISHGLPGQWRPAELPGGGMPRTIGNEDGSAGPFPIPECPGNRGHYG